MTEPPDKSIRNLALLLQGQFVSNLGNQVYDIAMLLWIKELTGSAAVMGLALLLTNLPEALLAPFGGALADRHGKLKTLILSDLASGLFLSLLLVVCLLDAPVEVRLVALGLTNVLLGMSAACFNPAVTALIPSLVGRAGLEKANAGNEFSNVGGRVVGQGLGGVIFSLLGAPAAFAINAASFFLSALSETFIRVPTSAAHRPSDQKDQKNLAQGLKAVLLKVWRQKLLRHLLLYIAAFHLCLSSLPILLPFLAQHVLDLAAKWVGFLYGGLYRGADVRPGGGRGHCFGPDGSPPADRPGRPVRRAHVLPGRTDQGPLALPECPVHDRGGHRGDRGQPHDRTATGFARGGTGADHGPSPGFGGQQPAGGHGPFRPAFGRLPGLGL